MDGLIGGACTEHSFSSPGSIKMLTEGKKKTHLGQMLDYNWLYEKEKWLHKTGIVRYNWRCSWSVTTVKTTSEETHYRKLGWNKASTSWLENWPVITQLLNPAKI